METTDTPTNTTPELINDKSEVIEKVVLDNDEETSMRTADRAIRVITISGTGNLVIADQAFIDLATGVIKYVNQGAQYKLANGKGLEAWIVAAEG